jgi:DNA-binding transcriptional regulator YbjK
MDDGRRARGARTREALVDSAIELIVTEGVAAATQRRVATNAGLSLAAVTYHFRSADDLLVAAFEETGRRVVADVSRLAEQVVGGRMSLIEAALAMAARRPYGDTLPADGFVELCVAAVRQPRLREPAEATLDAMAEVFTPLTASPESARTLARALTGLILHELVRGEAQPSAALRADLGRIFDVFGVTGAVAAVMEAATSNSPKETA